jgi:pantoate--beta-alanine ligase
VATVVAKLLHIIAPRRAYFGQKDAAQLAVLRQMVRDLNFDVDLIGCAIVRDADGLALSSRNRYLSAVERERALVLHRTLLRMEQMIAEGERQSETLKRQGMAIMDAVVGVHLDYLAVVDANSLVPMRSIERGALVAVAARVGNTRLIDNFLVR